MSNLSGFPCFDGNASERPKFHHSFHIPHYRQICKLYEEEKLCDVTFRVGRERSLYKAHRVVLASANR